MYFLNTFSFKYRTKKKNKFKTWKNRELIKKILSTIKICIHNTKDQRRELRSHRALKEKKGNKKKHVLMFDRHLPRCIIIHQIDLACPLVLKASRQTNLVNECKHAHCTYPTGTLEENSRKQTIIIIRALITIEK